MSLNRFAKRKDANQGPICAALRAAGCAVFVTDKPLDLIVYNPRKRETLLVEVKNPDGFNRLTVEQKKFRESWTGPWYVVRSVEEALALVSDSP